MSVVQIETLQEEHKKLKTEKENILETNIDLQNNIIKLEKELNEERIQNIDMQKELHK